MGFAHRGLHGPGIPENSLAAFAAALDIGAGIECDLQLSRCGTAMVFHDRDGERLCGQSAAVSECDVATLGDWRLNGSDQHVPTLAELLRLVAGRAPILLELKEEHRNGERVAAAALAALSDYDGPVGIMSFSSRAIGFARKAAPHVRRGLVFSNRDLSLRRTGKLRRARPDFVAAKASIIDRAWARALRARMPLYSWTARTPADAAKVAQCADAPIWEGDGRPRP